MDLSSYDLEYLRPPFEASFINHNLDYIKSGSGINAKRKIFYNVSFESDELKAIQELESLLQSQGITLPEEWNQSETLKFLYAQKFNLQAAAETIQTCLEWREDPQTSLIDDNVLQYLEAGVIYVYGLDHQFRPILIINLNKLRHLQIDEDTFKIALVIVMDVIRTYCFLPRKIENCLILIDAQGVKTIDPDNIKTISYLLRSCFPSTFEKIILITSPNFKDSHFQLIHSVANKEELEDVQIISSSDMKVLQTFIPAEHLEKKYGGECPTVEKFWPPPKRNELYHRTSVTSLRQYSEAGSIGNIPKENLSALSKSNLSARQGNIMPETSELKQYTFADNPRTPQSVQSEMLKFQPNQLGHVGMTQSEEYMKRSAKASAFDKGENLSQQRIPSNTKIPSQNDLRFKSEDNFGRNTAPIQPGSNQESPSKKYKANDPFARVRNEEAIQSGRTNLSVHPNNNNNGINLESAERFVIREAEAPKAKRPVSHWDMKMEPTSLHKQLSSQASEIDSQSRGESPIQGKRKMLPTTTVTPTHRREPSQPGDPGNRVSYAVYGGGSNNKPGAGHQNEVDNGNTRPQQRNGRTFEENEVETPSMASYSQNEKEKVKKRLVEISAKKAEESDEEDAKSKKGLFCGCCVGSKKKDTLLRSKSKMKKSKYDY